MPIVAKKFDNFGTKQSYSLRTVQNIQIFTSCRIGVKTAHLLSTIELLILFINKEKKYPIL